MNREEIKERIVSKREFSKLPEEDIWLVYKKFERRQCSEEEKIRLTRDLLRKVYSAFTSGKLLNIKDKDEDWFLRKHLSTRERRGSYKELYEKLLSDLGSNNCSVIDLGSGINGFSYKLFPKKLEINYIGVEAVGQFVDLMNFYLKKEKLNAKAIHESLFNLKKIKELIESCKKPRIIFLFKVIDSLEMVERDYSKRLLEEITPLCEKVVVSFATRSMIKQDKFRANRKWIIDFIKENFELLEDFEMGNERYLIFKSDKSKV
jgi:hypothetical protein